MNYLDFLMKKINTMDEKNANLEETKSESAENTTDAGSLFLQNNFSQVKKDDGSTIFSIASSDELKNVDYENLVSDETKAKNGMGAVLKDFFSFESVRKAADTDGDGKLSADEARAFLEKTSAKDGDSGSLSTDDLQAVIDENNIDLEKAFNQFKSAYTEGEIPSAEKQDVQTPQDIQSPQDVQTPQENVQTNDAAVNEFPQNQNNDSAVSTIQDLVSGMNIPTYDSSPASQGSYSPTYSSESYSSASAPVEKTIDSMSLDELQVEKSKRETTLKEKQDALNAVSNGNNEKIKAAKKEADEAKKSYQDALANDSELKKTKSDEKVLKVMNEIDQKQAELDDTDVKINEKEVEISNQEDLITSLNAEQEVLTSSQSSMENALSDLKASLSKVGNPTGKEEDKAKDAEINNKKKQLGDKISAKQKEISQKKKEISDKNKEIKEANKKLENLKKNLESLTENKTKLEEKLSKLNEDKAKLEEEISKKCSKDTKDKMDAYNKAVKNVETVKSEELSTAKAARTEALTSLKQVNTKISEVKNRKVTEDLNIEGIPAKYRNSISEKTLPNGTKVLTFGYTNYKDLQPELQEQIGIFTQVAAEKGYTFVISDGFRSKAESDRARAIKGNMVAPGGKSPHNYGAAFDCGLYKDGKEVGNRKEWEDFASEVKKRTNNQITWGGDFKSKPYEVWHFECKDWKKYRA